MDMLSQINTFVDTMLNEQEKFETMSNQISRKENEVAGILAELETNEKQVIAALTEKIVSSKDESIKAIFSNTSQNLFDMMQV